MLPQDVITDNLVKQKLFGSAVTVIPTTEVVFVSKDGVESNIASLANLKVRYEIENNESVSKATYALLDTRKIKNIGWEPQYSVKDGLKRTYTIKKETLGSM